MPGFSSFVHIVQSKDTVAFLMEEERRVVPLGTRPPMSDKLRSWAGDSRGHWEGDTLVIETTNFNGRTRSLGVGNALAKVVTERFTRVWKDRIDYEATVVDPKAFLDKVVLSFPMTKSDVRIFESACHEGNYALANMLSGARADERPK